MDDGAGDGTGVAADATAALLAAVPIPLILISPDGRIGAANAAAQELFGGRMTGRHHGLTLRYPALLAAIEVAGQAGRGETGRGETRRGETGVVRHVITGPSHEVIHRVSVTQVPQGVLCAFEDISEQEQAGQMRRDFVANVSHELRTPLTALLGFIETLKGAARDDAVARERFLTIMAREAERMNRLVRDLLHLSRVEAQERMRPTERTDLAALISSAVASLRQMAEAQGVELTLQGLETPLEVPADGDQITQVVTNLIENAVKYGGSGKRVTVRLGREAGPRGPQARIEVIDHGEGIEAVHLPRLTERFYRVDGHRSREKGGTGLGLAIVKHVVNRHRGRLVIESERGKGSVFAVILPEA